jgi:phosphoribosylanthranilate isomerase
MTEIKICGITRVEDALVAARLGADYLGFIFVPVSPRCVTSATARAIADAVHDSGATTKLVGVFRDETPAEVNRIAAAAGLDFAQLHGDEPDEHARVIDVPVIKAFRVGETLPSTDAHGSAAMLLFDSRDDRRAGGTGRRFDWTLLADYPRTRPFFLAGGIDPDNVAAAISAVRPSAIDIASGVEESPGIKSHERMQRLFERVRQKSQKSE